MKLYMGIAKLLHIRNQFLAVFPLVKACFINRCRLLPVRVFFAAAHPVLILPLDVSGRRGNYGSGSRGKLCASPVRVCFKEFFAVFEANFIFIKISFFDAGNKKLVNTGHGHSVHHMASSVPAVKISYNIDADCVGSPDSKTGSLYTA